MTPKRATYLVRKTQTVFMDYVIETINGRRLGRLDQYIRDALGEARVDNQTWFDLETKLPVRKRQRLQVAYQHEYKREFSTTEYDYPATGPADLFAIGVPKGTPVVNKSNTRTGPRTFPRRSSRMRGAGRSLAAFPAGLPARCRTSARPGWNTGRVPPSGWN